MLKYLVCVSTLRNRLSDAARSALLVKGIDDQPRFALMLKPLTTSYSWFPMPVFCDLLISSCAETRRLISRQWWNTFTSIIADCVGTELGWIDPSPFQAIYLYESYLPSGPVNQV